MGLADKMKNKTPLSGMIPAGATRLIEVRPPMALSNKGHHLDARQSRREDPWHLVHPRAGIPSRHDDRILISGTARTSGQVIRAG